MASEQHGSICGEVYFQATGAPAAGVAVELTGADSQFTTRTQTDWGGRFQFSNLRSSRFVVSIELPGYERIQESVQLDGHFQEIELRLRSDRSGPPPSAADVVSVRELRIPNKARDALQKGMERLQKKDPAGSLAQLTRAAAAYPGYYEAYYQMGVAHIALGQRDEAEQAFQKAIDLSQGRYAEAQFGMGLLFCERGQYREAEPIIRKGLDVDMNSARGQYALARALFGQGRLAEAEKSARRAIFLNSAFALPRLVLADIHIRERNDRFLMDDLDAYLRLEPHGAASKWAKKTRPLLVANSRLVR